MISTYACITLTRRSTETVAMQDGVQRINRTRQRPRHTQVAWAFGRVRADGPAASESDAGDQECLLLPLPGGGSAARVPEAAARRGRLLEEQYHRSHPGRPAHHRRSLWEHPFPAPSGWPPPKDPAGSFGISRARTRFRKSSSRGKFYRGGHQRAIAAASHAVAVQATNSTRFAFDVSTGAASDSASA